MIPANAISVHFFFVLALIGCSSQAANNPSPEKQQTVTTPVNNTTISNDEMTSIYVRSIADYIKAVNETYKIKFDTLYFGKRAFGQPDDFPDIHLPETIENTQIRLVTPEVGTQKQQQQPTSFYINLIAWVNDTNADFLFVAFSEGFKHLFDCNIKYGYDAGLKDYKMSDLQFKNFLYKKR